MKQDYQKYTENDHQVWKMLFERQMKQLPTLASQAYLDGLNKAGFVADHIPDFENETNPRLISQTGWQVVPVDGLIPEKEFFELLSQKHFPATTWLRKLDELEYLEEPDMFHDTFGHVPLLTNQHFCDFLAHLSKIALPYLDNQEAIEMIKRLYWFTVEFGLIRESNELKIYGGGILSSSGETIYSLYSGIPERNPYEIEEVIRTIVKIDEFQKKYFIINSYEQLYHSLNEFEKILENQLLVC